MARSREELVEALRARVREFGDVPLAHAQATIDLLTEAADFLDSLEERGAEYRAAGADGTDKYMTVPQPNRDYARRLAKRLDLSLQRRTVFTTPWKDDLLTQLQPREISNE